MKQSNNKKSRDVTAFLYERLSRDDNLEGESYSIGNQKKLLAKVAKEKGYTNLVHFLDDGISGVTMDRPGFVEMICQLEQGKAAAVFVKDLSRLGRNYIEVGRLTEEFFPDHDIRLVAVSDNIDTAEGENELAPIRNLFNEWYARDISKKRRISNKIKGNAGEPMGQPPYGYIKDPNDPKHWIVDDEAAQVVRRVYSMTLEGFGTEQIAAQLEKDDVLTPRAYWLTKGIKRPGKGKQQPPTKWNSSTIAKILSLQEYCGDILNFKTYSKSYKNKKRIDNDRENWVVFQDVHEAIIERAVYEQVQQTMIDALDQGEYVHILGTNGNRTDLNVQLHPLNDPKKETIFENCVADVNIPVGEVFTSPVLEGTNGVLHVSKVYLNELQYRDLEITFSNGMVSEYNCANFERELENKAYIHDNVLYKHPTLPLGEFAIGTNTTAYVTAKKYGIEDKMPILIAEKTGPHFAVGDTCYSWSEEIRVYNPNGKEIVAKDNSCSLLRKEDVSKAYFNCHTDITVPYKELEEISVVTKDGTDIILLRDGRFVLPGTEVLNEPLEKDTDH